MPTRETLLSPGRGPPRSGRTPKGSRSRTCLGILRLYRGIDPARAEAVSARAVEIGALTYKSIVSIITHKLDKKNSVEDGWTPAQTHALAGC